MDPNSSFGLTIMASLAEEESRSISTNTKWGTRKRFKEGNVRLNTNQLWGYRYDSEGNVQIIEKEAEIIRRIYHDFASGMTPRAIAEELNDLRIPTKCGADCWYPGVISSILTNEKYMGDMLLQKTFKPDFLSKQRKNNGEVEAYYVPNHHPPIIDKDFFHMVQYIIKRDIQMKAMPVPGIKFSQGRSVLSAKVFCGDCGSQYTMKNQDNKNGPVRTWVCSRHRISKDCPAIPIKEQVIFNALEEALNAVLENKNEHILKCKEYAEKVYYSIYEKEEFYKRKLAELDAKLEELAENGNYESGLFLANLEAIRNEINSVKAERDRVIPSYHVRRFRADKSTGMISCFDKIECVNMDNIIESIDKMVEKIIVMDNDLDTESINVILCNGEGLNVKLENRKKRKCKHRVCYREKSE